MLRNVFIKKMPAVEHFEVVLMFKTVKTPPTVKSPSPTLRQIAKINTSHLPQLRIQEPTIVEHRRSRPIGSTTSSTIANRVDRFTCREPLAFERNTG